VGKMTTPPPTTMASDDAHTPREDAVSR